MNRDEVWMKVTRDKFQLPIAVADSIRELSQITGHSEDTIRSSISHQKHGRIKRSSFIRVSMEEEETHGINRCN